MTTGVRIFNDFGTILIDDQSQVLTLRSVNDQTSNGGTNYDYHVYDTTYPQFFFSNCPNGLLVNPFTWSNQEWPGFPNGWHMKRMSVSILATGAYSGKTTKFKGWVFDIPLITATPSTHGLKIFNEMGVLMFDALQKNARIVGIINGYGSMAVPPGRVYAIGILESRYEQRDVLLPTGYKNWSNQSVGSEIYASETEVGIREGIISAYVTSPNPSSTNPNVVYGTPRALVIDVTDY